MVPVSAINERTPILKQSVSITKFTNEVYENSVLFRTWKPACAAAWTVFITFQVFIGANRAFSPDPLCPYSAEDYGDTFWYINYSVFGGFLLILFVLVMKTFQVGHTAKAVPLYVACNIVTMGSIATFLILILEWGGFCVDVLNVASPAAIWGEWIACGPLLIYITVTIVDKPDLTPTDWALMICFFVCLVTGFFIIVPESYAIGVFWLVVSCVTYIPVLYLPWYDGGVINTFDPEDEKNMTLFATRFAKHTNLSIWLTIILPFYTVNYLLAMWGFFGVNTTIVVYQVLSILTKGLFAGCTMDIHLDLLIQAERDLIDEYRINNARRVFMKYIFHEIRNPLSSICVGVQLLKTSPNLIDEEQEALMMMEQASSFMSDTLDNVLSIQKIEEGKFELELKAFNVDTRMRELTYVYGGILREKSLKLQCIIAPNVPRNVIGDGHRISHVVSNLLSNAIKFSPNGTMITLELSCAQVTSIDGNEVAHITFSVIDQGIGISEGDQKRLFNSFVQIRPNEIQKGKGSGLGLCFCKEIVNLHKGNIWIESKEGEGSAFKFTVPFALPKEESRSLALDVAAPERTVEMVEMHAVLQKAEAQAPPGGWLSNLHVLIVDDAASNCKILGMLLKRRGIKSDMAENGKIAVDMVAADKEKYHLIFMDNLMPQMSGLEASAELRKLQYGNLIIGLTGNVMDDDVAEFSAAGVDAVLGKPLQMDSIDRILKTIEAKGPFSRPGISKTENW